MARHALVQDTPEWHEFRKGKIGASDVAAIMGVSPYVTPYQLWRRMVGIDPPLEQTESMRFGKEKEEQIRHMLMSSTGMIFVPAVFSDDDHPFLIASLDGITIDEKTCAELKVANKVDHALALAGRVPEKYIPQTQVQLSISKTEVNYYTSFHNEEICFVRVYPDEKKQKEIKEACLAFYDCVETKTPPPLMERDYVTRDDSDWIVACEHYKNLVNFHADVEGHLEEAKQKLIKLAGERNSKGAGLSMQKVRRQGNIDYTKIIDKHLQGINLDDYRRPDSLYWKITFEKN